MRCVHLSLSLVPCCMGVLLLAGCGGDGGGRQPGAGGAHKKLTFWHIQTKDPTKGVIAGAVKRFEKANPGCSVEVLAYENDAYKNKLRLAMPADSAPDVFHTWGGGALAAEARAGRVLDLGRYVTAKQREDYHAAALSFCTADGKLLALPADLSAVVFWYNREIFRTHGVAVPKTWKQLLSASAKLKSAGVTPIALGNSDSWPGAFYFIYFGMRCGGAEPFASALARKPGKGFEHESFMNSGRRIRELATSGYLSGGFNGRNYTQMRGDFFGGRAAMMLMGSWILANARKEAPEGFLAKMGCFAFPQAGGSAADQSLVVGGVNAAYAVSSRCAHPDLAVKLVLELTSVESARRWAATGRIPALRKSLVEKFLAPETKDPAAVLAGASGIQLYYDQALSPELAQLHKSTTQGLFAGTKTPAEAARLMEAKARSIAARKGK